jgi:hypothetical protein
MALAKLLSEPLPTSSTRELWLVLDHPARSIIRVDDPLGINLCDREWEYVFLDDANLRLSFKPSPLLALTGHATQLGETNDVLASPMPLVRLADGTLIFECPAPAEYGSGPRIALEFVAERRTGDLGRYTTEFLTPCEANPKLIFKPKRSTPTSGSNNQPTIEPPTE